MINVIFSLWTGTPKFQLNRNELAVATLAIALANRHKPVDFHTDSVGLEIANELGWHFRAKYETLDFIPDDAPREVWCYSKLFLLSQAIMPTLHVDLDVLMHNALPSRVLAGELIAQSIDIPEYYSSEDIAKCLRVCGFAYEGRAFNAGIIGGTNVEALNRYAREAMALATRFKGLHLDPTSASMVVEQYYLGRFAHDHGIRVETLFKGVPTVQQAAMLGYNHLHGENKRDPRYVEKVLARLEHDYPTEYERFCQGWARLESRLWAEKVT